MSIVARVTCTKLPTSIVVNKPWIPFRPFVFFLWSKVVSDKIVCIWNHCSFLILWLFNLFHLWTPKNWIVILFTNGHTLPFREDMRIWCCIKMKPFSCKVCFFSSLVSSWLSQNCKGKIHVDLFRQLTLYLSWVNKSEFLLTISIHYQVDNWWEWRKISIRGL